MVNSELGKEAAGRKAEEAINGKEVTKGLQVQLSMILGLLATPLSTERHLIELCNAQPMEPRTAHRGQGGEELWCEWRSGSAG